MKNSASEPGPLWAVTSYFNPVGYRRRSENFQTFRDRLTVPLAAVELSFNGQFQLKPGDAEILIQIHGRDVMWQKERLLNVAVQALPVTCTKVAILDCDVVFVRPDWFEALSRRLDEVPLVQPYSLVHYLPRDLLPSSPQALAGEYTRPSTASLIEGGTPGKECLKSHSGRRPGTRASGHALAARREFLQIHGLYDACIIGGGDTALIAAASGACEHVIRQHAMNNWQTSYYLGWAQRVQRAIRGEIGHVPGDLLHLWHGEMSDRRSPERYHDFAAFAFNPYQDIALDAAGCWQWNSDKPAMHAYARTYFANRKEDGPPEVAIPKTTQSSGQETRSRRGRSTATSLVLEVVS